MRKFGSNFKQILESGNISIFYCVELGINNTKHTSLPYSITIPSLGTYIAGSGLISIEPPNLTRVVDRESYKVVYADPSFEFLTYFENGAIGASVVVRVGMFNTTENNILGFPPGAPILDESEIAVAYKGVVDAPIMSIDPEGSVTVTLVCSSPMVSLDMVKPYMNTREYARVFSPGDTAFDQVSVGSSSVNLLWGKA